MEMTYLEKKLQAYQLIINRAITQNKYPIAVMAAKLALEINPVCDITRTLQSIIQYRQGKYTLSTQNLVNIITTVDNDTFNKVQSLLTMYDIPCDIAYYECLQDIHIKIRNDKIINILLLFIMTIVAVGIPIKIWG